MQQVQPSPVVVLAGGLGTRMRDAAPGLPKALVPVLGEPFAFHQLRLLASQGVREVVYVIGHLGSQIRAAVGDGDAFGLGVSYVDEGESLRGTGGALRFAHDRGTLPDVFGVLYGDSYLPIDLDADLAGVRRLAAPGSHDGAPKRRPLGQEQRVVRGRPA